MLIRWFIFLIAFGTFAHTQNAPSVVISEVMWMGSDLSTADEWIELTAIDGVQTLSGWILTRLKDGEEEVIVRFGEDASIGSGEFLVISNYGADQSRLFSEPALSTTAMVLPNTKLLLRLRDKQGNLIDSIDDGVGEPFAGSNDSASGKASMERIDLSGSGGLKSNWKTATLSLGFDSGALLFGTPGYANGNTQIEQNNDTEIQDQSFNTIKISELLSDPSGSDTDGEWIEIINTGSGAVNLSGLMLQVEEGGSYILGDISLGSGEYLALDRPQTGLSLRNAGDTIRLLHNETLLDFIEYPQLPEGVSYGRLDGSLRSFCIPTKDRANAVIFLDPQIHIQSGQTHEISKVTINLEATVLTGSLASALCSWEYGDGYTSDSCNPPSHTFRTVGRYDVQLSLTDYCSNTVERMLEIGVLETGVYQEESFNFSPESSGCTPSVSTGILIHDFLPNPEGKDKGGNTLSDAEFIPSLSRDGAGEWIELTNINPYVANLCGWVLDDIDGGSKEFKLDRYTIDPGGFLKIFITDSKIALNNDGDSVRLFFNSNLIQEIAYPEIPEGRTYRDYSGGLPLPEGGDEGEGDQKVFTGTILITELYPAPLSGEEEWLELFNPSDEPVNISGLFLDDFIGSGSKAWPIPDGTVLPANQYILFRKEQTKLALNNDGDDVNIIGPDGVILDTVTYSKLKRGLSYSRIHHRWCESNTPTPLKENICPIFSAEHPSLIGRGRGGLEIKNEEKYLTKGLNSNSRSNNMFKNIYQYILPSTPSQPPAITSPFLAEVLEMAKEKDVTLSVVEVSSPDGVYPEHSRRARDDTGWEPLLISLMLFSGLWGLSIFPLSLLAGHSLGEGWLRERARVRV